MRNNVSAFSLDVFGSITSPEAWVALCEAIGRDFDFPAAGAHSRLTEALATSETSVNFYSSQIRHGGASVKDAAIEHGLTIVVTATYSYSSPGYTYWVRGTEYSGEFAYDDKWEQIRLSYSDIQNYLNDGRTLESLVSDMSLFEEGAMPPFQAEQDVILKAAQRLAT